MVYGWGGSIGKSLIPEISQSVSNNNNSNDSKTTDASSNGKPPCDEDLSLSQEKHSAIISSVLSKTVKLRKDVARNRKNKVSIFFLSNVSKMKLSFWVGLFHDGMNGIHDLKNASSVSIQPIHTYGTVSIT